MTTQSPSPCYHLIYMSTATQPMGAEALKALLDVARIKNEALNVTGMLLYRSGHFMQVIEGAKESIEQLKKKIYADTRHHHIVTLVHEKLRDRDFKNWSMGFEDLSYSSIEDIPGFTDFLKNGFQPELFKHDPTQAYKLLMRFKRLPSD